MAPNHEYDRTVSGLVVSKSIRAEAQCIGDGVASIGAKLSDSTLAVYADRNRSMAEYVRNGAWQAYCRNSEHKTLSQCGWHSRTMKHSIDAVQSTMPGFLCPQEKLKGTNQSISARGQTRVCKADDLSYELYASRLA